MWYSTLHMYKLSHRTKSLPHDVRAKYGLFIGNLRDSGRALRYFQY